MKTLTAANLRLPRRDKDTHKGRNGRVLIVGGSEDYPGAVALAGIAALRSGCDYVTIAAPEKVAWAVNCLSPDLVTKKLKGATFKMGHLKDIQELAERHDVVLLGNGMTTKPRAFIEAVARLDILKVIDADALRVVRLQDISRAILTPHKREVQALLESSGMKEDRWRERLGDNIVIRKGRADHIISATKQVSNTTGHPAMSKAGTGDVLAGLAAGFLAQTKDLWRSACLAAYYNGLTGERLGMKKGDAYLASDLAQDIARFAKG